MPQIRATLGIGIANSRQEDVLDIDDAEWDKCETDEEREELMNDYWQSWANDYIDGSCELIE